MQGSDRFTLEDVRCAIGERLLPVENLSVGGFFVAWDVPAPRGHGLAVELVFPGGERIPAVGRVAWVNDPAAPSNPSLPPGCGITITKIAFTDKLAVVQLLRRAAAASVRETAARAS